MKKICISLCSAAALTGCATEDIDLGSTQSDVRAADHKVVFEDVSTALTPFSRAGGEGLGGIAWLDYDNDDDLDLYLTNGYGSSNGLFRNDGDGDFEDVTASAGVAGGFGNSGVLVADIDNDGFSDIFLTGEGHLVGPAQTPNRLYHNNGDGTFSEIAAPADAGSALGASFGDINGDGFLDLFVASPGHIPFLVGTGESHPNKLYLNNGDLSFTDISQSAGIEGLYPAASGLVSDGACVSAFTDYDQDGDADILVGNCNAFPEGATNGTMPPVRPTPFNLYRNNGDSTFTDVATSAGLNVPGFWMGLALGDYDNDGDIDFFATSTGTFNGLLHVLMSNNGDGTFTNVGDSAGVAASEFGWGATMADFDNDGDLDLYQVGSLPLFGAVGPAGSPGRLYFNDGAGSFVDETDNNSGANLSMRYTSGVVQGDYDSDGFADLVVMTAPWFGNPTDGAPVLLHNQGNGNNAVTLRLEGTASNRSAIGALVEIKTAHDRQIREVRAGSSMASTDSPWPSFGIGKRDSADVRITWPSGLVEEFSDIAAGMNTLVEGTGDSDDDHGNHGNHGNGRR